MTIPVSSASNTVHAHIAGLRLLGTGRIFWFSKLFTNTDRVSIGRTRQRQIRIEDPSVSRLHCVLEKFGHRLPAAESGHPPAHAAPSMERASPRTVLPRPEPVAGEPDPEPAADPMTNISASARAPGEPPHRTAPATTSARPGRPARNPAFEPSDWVDGARKAEIARDGSH